MISCASTNHFVKVDPVKKDIEVQSSSDYKSALPNLAENGAVVSSIEKLEKYLKENPGSVKSLLNLAQLKLVQSNFEEAENACRKALKVDVKSTEARKILAQIYFRKGNLEMTKIILNGLGGLQSKDSQIVNMMAMVAFKEERKSRALSLFHQALKLNPSDIAARMNLGVLHIRYRQLKNAAIQFERVLKIMPDHDDAKLHLAIVLTSQGKFSQAEKVYRNVLTRKDNNPLAMYNMAVLENRRENYGKAMELLEEYMETNHAQKSEDNEIFVLIDDIRNKRAAASKEVSNSDIEDMVEDLGSRLPSAKKAQPEKPVAASEPVENSEAEEDDDISALEKQLE